MDERKVREKMSKSIPGGSSKDLDALIAQYNKDLTHTVVYGSQRQKQCFST